MAVAREYNSLGVVSQISWANDSIWKNEYGDTHLIYHQLLRMVDFVDVDIWISFWIALILFTYLICSKLKSNLEVVYFSLIFLFSSVPFIGRLMFGKGLLIFLVIFFLFIHRWKKKDGKWVFLLSFLAIWTYPLAPLLLVFAMMVWICERYFFPRFITEMESPDLGWSKKGIVLTLSGLLFGILIHPSFPNQFLAFYLEWWAQIIKPSDIEPIAEWNPPGFLLFLKTYYILIILFFLTRFKENIALGLIAIIGIFVSCFNTKTLEWTVPILLIYLSTSIELRKLIKNKIFLAISFFVLVIQLLYLGSDLSTHSKFVSADQARNIAKSSCINSQIPNKSKIFIRWDDFPVFSYECPEHIYPFGMNPIYSYYHNRQRYLMIRRFWEDKTIDPSAIPIYLGYDYLVINSKRDGEFLSQNISQSGKWNLLIEFENYFLFEKVKIEGR
ncbi:hypothetical protein [Leptospira sp. GIMC2001]|uniref:hypothetical protein n=1 Tax=Leptospira sp. GIMC2001 TaxID=1513297 RepID=UPI00234A0743|nr:hypothetical protein [Leptospira sp. GIMC2001]WCL49058.1 hypothetical protein O4O04_17480 [Leptospira sp. GIMC2001]